MNKTLISIVILIFLILPSQFLMLKGYKSLDGRIHSARIQQFHEALSSGQFPVRLAPTILDGIGYPLFVVNYQIPYYFAEPFILLKKDPMFAYKAVMSITYLLSGILAFYAFKAAASTIPAITGAVVLSYLPYRFGDLYMRGAYGESVSFMFVPAIFLALHLIIKGHQKALILLALSIFGLISSHTVIFVMFAPLIIFYVLLILKPNKQTLKLIVIGLIWGSLLSSFQLAPAILEKHYMKFDQPLTSLYKDFFIDFYQLLRIPKAGINTGTYLQIGIVSTLLMILSSFLYLKKRSPNLLFFIIFALISIFLTQQQSRWFWQHLPLIAFVLYPYRFLLITILATSFLAVYVVEKLPFKHLTAFILIFLTIYTNRHFVKIAPWFEIQPTVNLTTQNENDTIWSNEETFKPRAIVTTSEPVQISNLSQDPFKISFLTTPDKETKIIIRKMYFPGWQATVNGKSYPIQIEDGLIKLDLEPGSSQIAVFFKESPLRKAADLITLISFAALIIFVIKFKNSKTPIKCSTPQI